MPIFLFLFPDQWRWDWLGCEESPYGKVPVQTPNIDHLATSGVRLSGCRTNAPVCAPARACLSLGVRYHRCEVPGNSACTPPERGTFFRHLREAGYHTATCGKSDLFKPMQEPSRTGYLPVMDALGFSDGIDHRGKGDAVKRGRNGIDEPYTFMLRERGLLQTHLDDHPEQALNRAAYPTPLPRDCYTDDFCGQNAVKLLERAPKDQPWCLWVNFPGPHDPYDPPAEHLTRYEGVTFPPAIDPTDAPPPYRNAPVDRLHYAACCSNIDDWVGRIIEAVKERGELDDTIIIFSSDHGELLGDHGRWGKSAFYESSIRVPLIMAGPGIAQGEESETPVELIDLAATILDFAGEEVPREWDSRSLRPVLEDPARPHRDHAIAQLGNWRCVTTNEWKYVERKEKPAQLFDLRNDPEEMHNVLEQNPRIAAQFAKIIKEENPWMLE